MDIKQHIEQKCYQGRETLMHHKKEKVNRVLIPMYFDEMPRTLKKARHWPKPTRFEQESPPSKYLQYKLRMGKESLEAITLT